ncbi:MAG TPA: hypothetical protein VJI32_00895 [Candidatus Nanoarchaeia archaeon]|nr:hypothetical protein [Candidatus Nanoarchaeia archaeon]
MQKKRIFNLVLLGVALLLVSCTQSPPGLPIETAPLPSPLIETDTTVPLMPTEIPSIEPVTLDSEQAVLEQLNIVLQN